MMGRIVNRLSRTALGGVEKIYRMLEKTQLSRGGTLALIPPSNDRLGGLGTTTYGEWCYTLGFFQSLIFKHLPDRPIKMLDVGCGVGRLFLAVRPYFVGSDHYTGLDIGEDFIKICQERYAQEPCDFLHVAASNPYYADHLQDVQLPWPVADGSFNLVTGLSVWTHLNEQDWRFYLAEVGRKLAVGGRAIITFFILDDLYEATLNGRTDKISRFYPQPENKWIFDKPAYDSTDWYYPGWASVPEVAIGVRRSAFDRGVADAGLKVVEYFPGSWKEQPGLFFQDIVVFEKR
jgi:SAM-dependent methyltransferase